MREGRQPSYWSHLRWRIALLLCLVTIINYIDRQALSVIAPVLMQEFQLSNQDYGWITSAFLLAYALGQFCCGPLIDRLGARRAFPGAVAAWSVAGMAHALSQGFLSLFSYRFLLGLAEAANFPAALKTIAEWFPQHDRATAVGILTMGPGLGAVIAPPLIATLTVVFGWRWAFVLAGLLGFVWIILWYRIYNTPEEHSRISPAELALITSGRVAEEGAASAARAAIFPAGLMQDKTLLGLCLSRFVADGSFYFFIFWLPAYLANARGMDILTIGLLAWVPYLAVDIGSITGGWASSRLLKAGYSLDFSRKSIIWLGAALVPLGIPAAYCDSALVAIGFIAIAMFAIQFKSAVLFALPADMYPPGRVATIWGIFGAAGSVGGMLFGPLIGWVVDSWSYTPVIICAGLMHILSALCINVFIPRIKPVTAHNIAQDRH